MNVLRKVGDGLPSEDGPQTEATVEGCGAGRCTNGRHIDNRLLGRTGRRCSGTRISRRGRQYAGRCADRLPGSFGRR